MIGLWLGLSLRLAGVVTLSEVITGGGDSKAKIYLILFTNSLSW